jgi:ribosomal protein S3
MPLNQLNKIIEYSKNYAITPFGVLGIKTWLYFS